MAKHVLLKRLKASLAAVTTNLPGLLRQASAVWQQLSKLPPLVLGGGAVVGAVLLWGLVATLTSSQPDVAMAADSSSPDTLASDALVPNQPTIVDPDPSLIADIQAQVAAIGDRFTTGLLQSVQAEFRRSRLQITVNDPWYDLTVAQQDKLAKELWQRTQQLDFENLQLRDRQGELIGRNPVVGKTMVILWRHH